MIRSPERARSVRHACDRPLAGREPRATPEAGPKREAVSALLVAYNATLLGANHALLRFRAPWSRYRRSRRVAADDARPMGPRV